MTAEVPATCTANGTAAVIQCANCTATTGGEPIPIDPDNHDWVVDPNGEQKAPTCAQDGVASYICTRCSKTRQEVLPATGHHYVYDEKDKKYPTCTESGSALGVCEYCGEKNLITVAALGHDWGKWKTVREATADKDGLQERVCDRCGLVQQRSITLEGTMPDTGVFTVSNALLTAILGVCIMGYIMLKRSAARK